MPLVKDLIKSGDVVCLQQDNTVEDAVKVMAEKKIGVVLVLDGDRLTGIFSERDLLTRVIAVGKNPEHVKLNDVMTGNLVVADADETLIEAMQKLNQINARHLPVIEEDRLVGVISIRDLLSAEIDNKNEEIKWLNAYIHYVPPGKE